MFHHPHIPLSTWRAMPSSLPQERTRIESIGINRHRMQTGYQYSFIDLPILHLHLPFPHSSRPTRGQAQWQELSGNISVTRGDTPAHRQRKQCEFDGFSSLAKSESGEEKRSFPSFRVPRSLSLSLTRPTVVRANSEICASQ